MVIPIRKIQADKLKELVVCWSKKGRGVGPKKLMRVQGRGTFPWWIKHGAGFGSHRCRLHHLLSHYTENGFINQGQTRLTKFPRFTYKSRKLIDFQWDLQLDMKPDIQVVQPIQSLHVDKLHEKPNYNKKVALWIRGVHNVILMFSAVRLCLPGTDICHLEWNDEICTRAPAPWTVFRWAKAVRKNINLYNHFLSWLVLIFYRC